MPKNHPIPVPHGIVVTPKQNDRWKCGLAATVASLLIFLLLLFSFKVGTKSTATGILGGDTESTGMEQLGTDPAGQNQVEQPANADSKTETIADEGSLIAESADIVDNGTNQDITLPVTDATSETPHESAIENLLRPIGADPDENMDSQPDKRQNRDQTGGDSLVKGDASVIFFGATGKGSKFVFVFDRSGSMMGRPLESVKRELIKSLEPLKSNHSFNVIAYDDRYEMWKDKLVSATKESKVNVIRFIESVSSRGGTRPREPLLAAIEQKPEIIFFMTDGEFVLNVDEICGKGKKIIINVVQFSDGLPLPTLQDLAKRSGGEFMLIKVGGLSDSL